MGRKLSNRAKPICYVHEPPTVKLERGRGLVRFATLFVDEDRASAPLKPNTPSTSPPRHRLQARNTFSSFRVCRKQRIDTTTG